MGIPVSRSCAESLSHPSFHIQYFDQSNYGFRFNKESWVVLCGLSLSSSAWGSIVFAISLGEHWKVVHSISIVLAPGIVGGILFAALQLLYLPNIALVALSYLTGIGFSFGPHSVINGSQVKIGQVPALPFVPALPTSVHRELIYASSFWLLFFIAVFLYFRRIKSSILHLTGYALNQGVRFFIVIAALAYLSAGELLTSSLNPIGVIWWRFVAALGVAYLAASIVVIFNPAIVQKVLHRG